MDIEILIEYDFRCYGHAISIGGMGYDKLDECEQDTFISDCITHEYIHAILQNTFNRTVSQLFDFIGDSLLNRAILKKGVCLSYHDMLWSDMFKEEGVQHLYNEYLIDNIDLIQAYIITGGK